MSTHLSSEALNHIPVYLIGSPELARMHEAMRDPPLPAATRADSWLPYSGGWMPLRTYSTTSQVYGAHAHGFQYIVDHGDFRTLNTLEAGQHSVESVLLTN